MDNQKHYLGDGLYVQDDGYMFTLSAPRGHQEHFVCLEDEVVFAFLRFIERSRGVKITVVNLEKKEGE